eukprot:gene47566-58272_t
MNPDARTAIIMPICNEDVATVFAGLRATCESLAATGHARQFDVFVLSDSYDPAIRLAGAVPVGVPMTLDYRIDWAAVRAAITPRTRAIMLNTPHNPSGRVATAEDLRELERIAEAHDLFVVSDEVYEHMVFDGTPHESVARYPGLAARSFLVSSFGKTFHVTGWKVGFVAAPPALSAAFRRLHQYTVFTVHTPTQHAIAAYLANPAPWQGLSDFYQAKRDSFRAALAATVICYRPKSALRDAGKALGVDLAIVEKVAKSHRWFDSKQDLLARLGESGLDPESKLAHQWATLAYQFLGMPRHLSQHVGGFVIAQDKLSRLVPIENASMEDRSVI